MKRFQFPLERVLAYRRQQAEAAEARLQQSRSESAYLRSRREWLEEAARNARRSVAGRQAVTGAELQAAEGYQLALEAQRGRMMHAQRQLERMQEKQLRDVVEARRQVELLETLRRRRLRQHQRELDRFAAEEAGQLHLAKIVRSRREGPR